MPIPMKNSENTKYFKFRVEGDSTTYTIPQTVNDGSDTIQFQSNWTKTNLPGSTEPMVAFNYVDAPTVAVNIKFHEDMWREVGLAISGYRQVISKFVAMIYPGEQGQIIRPPYCIIEIADAVYRGYFTNIRVNQSGIVRNGYKTTCEISGNFTIIKKYRPIYSGVANNFRTYFNDTQS